MTIVVVRDGVMALDSSVSCGDMLIGTAVKWVAVDPLVGGGYAAGAGPLNRVLPALRDVQQHGESAEAPEEVEILWLKADGSVREAINSGFYGYNAPYYALGSGIAVALGALSAGTTAAETVQIVCALMPAKCGGEIVVLRLTSEQYSVSKVVPVATGAEAALAG